MNEARLKTMVQEYWNRESCGTGHTRQPKFSPAYFNEIEKVRYRMEPEILEFAQFGKQAGKRVLEVGVGAGTDFVQWVRGGARAYGIDLTQEAIANTKTRLELEGLRAEDLRTGDCEALPFPDGTFDLVYSWGVIHHTPRTEMALQEIVRVCRPGGHVKVMVYHRHSMHAYYTWFRHAFLKLRPWKSLAWCLANHVESPGTKAYLPSEIRSMLDGQPVQNVKIESRLCYHDSSSRYPFMVAIKRAVARLLGDDKAGWFLLIEFERKT